MPTSTQCLTFLIFPCKLSFSSEEQGLLCPHSDLGVLLWLMWVNCSPKGKFPSLNVQADSLPSAGEVAEGSPALKGDSKVGFMGLT